MPSKILTLIFCFALAVFPLTGMAAASATTPANGAATSGNGGSTDSNDFFGWISFVYGFMLSAAAILAVLMLVIAGVEMMTAVEKWRTDAKQRIWNALLGLGLAAISYLILQTIHPAFLNLQIRTLKVSAPGATPVGPGPTTGPTGTPTGSVNKGGLCGRNADCKAGLTCSPIAIVGGGVCL